MQSVALQLTGYSADELNLPHLFSRLAYTHLQVLCRLVVLLLVPKLNMLGLSWQFTDVGSFERAVLVGDSATGANVLLVALLDGPLVGVTGSNDKRIDGPFDASGDGFTDGILVRSVTDGLLVGRGTLDHWMEPAQDYHIRARQPCGRQR